MQYLKLPKISSTKETGIILEVKRISFDNVPTIFTLSNHNGYIETIDGTIYKIPEILKRACLDLVSMCLTMGNIFPCKAEFGIINGNAYIDFPDI
jgi:hypothetical protein